MNAEWDEKINEHWKYVESVGRYWGLTWSDMINDGKAYKRGFRAGLLALSDQLEDNFMYMTAWVHGNNHRLAALKAKYPYAEANHPDNAMPPFDPNE